MTDRELMQQALEALERLEGWLTHEEVALQAALRERLAQPEQEQEPVAWRYRGNFHEFDPSDWAEGPVTPLYTTPQPRQWVGLTDEERNNLWRDVIGWGDPSHDEEDLMKAIEAKLKEKNA